MKPAKMASQRVQPNGRPIAAADREADMLNQWDETDLLRTDLEAAGPAPQRRQARIFAILLLAAAAIAAYVAFGNWTIGRRPTTAAVAPAKATEAAKPLGGDSMSVSVPPLDESDALVAELLKNLSSHPRVMAWLATKGLIRNFTAVVTNIAEGTTPTALVPTLRPSSRFIVIQRGTALYVDPKSYDRYNGLAEALASIDPAGSARLYATLKPRIEEAYRDLGNEEPLFDHTLERAIVLLLRTPVRDDPIAVRTKGLGYAFADERVERLTAAQKQLLRTGPQNARAIQGSLRAIAQALGIPPERLGAKE
jgi:Protein of unknown function (DUF3014)